MIHNPFITCIDKNENFEDHQTYSQSCLAKFVDTQGTTRGECNVPRPFAGIWSFYLLDDAALEKA